MIYKAVFFLLILLQKKHAWSYVSRSSHCIKRTRNNKRTSQIIIFIMTRVWISTLWIWCNGKKLKSLSLLSWIHFFHYRICQLREHTAFLRHGKWTNSLNKYSFYFRFENHFLIFLLFDNFAVFIWFWLFLWFFCLLLFFIELM